MAKDKSSGKDKGKDKSADAEAEDQVSGDGESGEEGGKKKPPLKLILIAAGAAVIVLGGGGVAAFMFLAPKPDAAHAHKTEKPKKDDKKDAKDDKTAPQIKDGPDGVVFFTMPDIVVNMQTADGKPTFLKLKLTFEVPDHDTADAMVPEAPRMRDMFQTFLRELRPEDLSGSQGNFQLRMEILRRVNLVVAPSKVNAVLIEEMLIN
ncbi:MAG TPA: flagellar basal body-associated FliL family protein [Caulobacteraceae bacterium]|nr:flagellar basal body-associated FliL family protein [Caulobacteraceae bacterium]